MRSLLVASFVAAGAVAAPAFAQPIAVGGEGAPVLVGSIDPVIATYLGTTASFSDNLYLVRPGDTDLFLFNNQAGPVGATVDLGSFAIGTELVFRLEVTDFSGIITNYFSGAASRNPDLGAHARVQSDYLTPGTTLVSFEDLPRDIDSSFNDLSFSFSGTVAGAVPEPATWAMLIAGIGLTGAGLRTRRRRVMFA